MVSENLKWTIKPARELVDNLEYRQVWDQLNAERGNLPFLCSDVISISISIFGDGDEQLMYASQGELIVAMFVLKPLKYFRWVTFQPSQLPLGSWVARPNLSLESLTRSAAKNSFVFCLVLSITQVDPLQAPRSTDAPDIRTDDYIETAWVPITGSFDDYWAERGKNLRQNMRKQRNRLLADGVTTRMQTLRSVADMGPALIRYGALESAGWKEGKGTAIHPENAQGRFYLDLFEKAARRNEALVFEYLFDDKTVAMNLCLYRQGQLIVLKTAYDESYKAWSPAFLLREEELQAIFGEGQIVRIEYFGRVMDWHTKFTAEKRMLYHHTQYRWAWLNKLANRQRHWQEQVVSKSKVETSPLIPASTPTSLQ